MGKTPFEITFGKSSLPQYLADSSPIQAVDAFVSGRDEFMDNLCKKLVKAQETMKFFANANRRDVHFKVGDWVMLKLRPHRQVTTTIGTYPMLLKHFYGPLQIIDHIGKVAFKLQLPDGCRIHPIFHCSILEPFHGGVATFSNP